MYHHFIFQFTDPILNMLLEKYLQVHAEYFLYLGIVVFHSALKQNYAFRSIIVSVFYLIIHREGILPFLKYYLLKVV